MTKLSQQLIAITSKLIAIPTVTPSGNESLCSRYLSQLLTSAGFKVSLMSKSANRTNVIGKAGHGQKSLLIACHMDTVETGHGWTTSPFKATLKNNKLYGRGAIDDKGPFAVVYTAAEKFLHNYPHFDGSLILAAVADEEHDNEFGIKYLLSRGLKADAALIPDGGYLNQYDYGEKGCLQIKIASYGKQEHSALQEKGQNAISNLTKLVTTLETELITDDYDHRFTPTKVNVSLFSGGEFANSIPAYAWAQFDIRFPLGITSLQLLTAINQLLHNHTGKFKVTKIYATEPHLTENRRLIDSFDQAGKSAGLPMQGITLAGNSIAKELTQAGIPAIAHYPATRVTAHEPNEYIEVAHMVKTSHLYYEFLKAYFGVKIPTHD